MEECHVFNAEDGIEIFRSEFAKKFSCLKSELREKFFESFDRIYKSIKENINDQEAVIKNMSALEDLGRWGRTFARDIANGTVFTVSDDEYEVIVNGKTVYVYRSTEHQTIDGKTVPVIPKKFIKKRFHDSCYSR